jgi:hypothetical protein
MHVCPDNGLGMNESINLLHDFSQVHLRTQRLCKRKSIEIYSRLVSWYIQEVRVWRESPETIWRWVLPSNSNAITRTIVHRSIPPKHNSIQRMDSYCSTIWRGRIGLHSLHCFCDEFVTWRWNTAETNERKYPVMPRIETWAYKRMWNDVAVHVHIHHIV